MVGHVNGKEVFVMPGFNGTGPMGEGPMTGGGRGNCNPYGRFSGGRGLGAGRGMRNGFGRGRGYGRGFGRRGAYPPQGEWYNRGAYGVPYSATPYDEANMLKAEAQAMKNELDALNKRIQELESQSSET